MLHVGSSILGGIGSKSFFYGFRGLWFSMRGMKEEERWRESLMISKSERERGRERRERV